VLLAAALLAAALAVGMPTDAGNLAPDLGASARNQHPLRRAVDPYTFGNPAFCAPQKPVEDFGISELPPLREAPASGDLPFGPETVRLGLFLGPVFTPGESVGFWLYSENFVGRTPLRWVVRNRIRLLDASGRAGRVTARGRTRVRTINAGKEVKLFLRPPRRLGFYRYEIEIAEFGGKRLARYSSYARVERKFWDARLGLDRDRHRPGQRVLSRVENFGSEYIAFGADFGIQRRRGEGWVRVRNPSGGAFPAWLGFAHPGLAGRCSPLSLPRDFPAGRYRIVKEVERSIGSDEEESYYLTAPFEVAKRTP